MIRVSCGSVAGLLDHQAAGERPCGTCAYADQVRRISAEGIPSRPAPAGWLPPVTREEAAQNAAVLFIEVGSYDTEYRARGTRKRRPLRAERAQDKAAANRGHGSKVA